MPTPAQAQWETLVGTTFAATPKLPFFAPGDTVWKPADFDGDLTTWNKAQRYEVLGFRLKTFDDAGTERFADASLDTEVTNAGTQPTDTTSGWFYRIKNLDSLAESDVHESELLGQTAMRTYVDTQVPIFIAS